MIKVSYNPEYDDGYVTISTPHTAVGFLMSDISEFDIEKLQEAITDWRVEGRYKTKIWEEDRRGGGGVKRREGKPVSEETRQKISATLQGIPVGEWEGYAQDSNNHNNDYCEKFNYGCRESNREKYGRQCFICGKDETDNGRRLSVHHVDMNKDQGCNDHKWKLVPLCQACHARAHNPIWQARIEYLLTEPFIYH